MLVPLGDCFNHEAESQVNFRMINTALHTQRQEEYLYDTDFDSFELDKADTQMLDLDITSLVKDCKPSITNAELKQKLPDVVKAREQFS